MLARTSAMAHASAISNQRTGIALAFSSRPNNGISAFTPGKGGTNRGSRGAVDCFCVQASRAWLVLYFTRARAS